MKALVPERQILANLSLKVNNKYWYHNNLFWYKLSSVKFYFKFCRTLGSFKIHGLDLEVKT